MWILTEKGRKQRKQKKRLQAIIYLSRMVCIGEDGVIKCFVPFHPKSEKSLHILQIGVGGNNCADAVRLGHDIKAVLEGEEGVSLDDSLLKKFGLERDYVEKLLNSNTKIQRELQQWKFPSIVAQEEKTTKEASPMKGKHCRGKTVTAIEEEKKTSTIEKAVSTDDEQVAAVEGDVPSEETMEQVVVEETTERTVTPNSLARRWAEVVEQEQERKKREVRKTSEQRVNDAEQLIAGLW